ncbi:polyprenol phosphomannose-dependent alpha 1,6 mannosyltransferase MptB [Plantactinospora sonchi]|uniref:Polyprenol phosphomannose-dependent alpha 1,6 mannosyltransferase MptB n=1 Tax=Plantactinospora sonchi TaxID=1544735 RepID=A0ABU7RW11_9ACTN
MPARDRLTRLRTVGFAATSVMAASAYGAGALPAGDADAAVLPGGAVAAPASYWWGLAGWLVGLTALAAVWWRLGARITAPAPAPAPSPAPAPGTVRLRALLGTGLLWAVPLLFAPPTGSRDAYAYACQGALWLDGVDPYTVGVLPGGCVWSDAVPALWRHTPTPYGPLAVAVSGGVVALARLVTTSTDAQLLIAVALLRAVALAGVLLVAGCLPRLARACGVDPVRASWLGLLSPLVMIHAVSGVHNDALMVGLVVAALWLSLSGRGPSATGGGNSNRFLVLCGAGALLGLAVAVKVTAVLAVPFVVLLGTVRTSPADMPPARTTRDRATPGRAAPAGPVVSAGGAVAAGGACAFAGLSLVTGLDLGWLGALTDTGRLVQWTSLPTGLGMAAGYLLRLVGHPEAFDLAVRVARLLGLVTLAATVVVLLVRAWSATSAPGPTARRRVVVATGLAFAALAVLSPVFYPWYALTAVAVLAAGLSDRWRGRAAGLVLLASFLVLPDGLGLAVLSKLPGALFDVALVVVLAVGVYKARSRRGRAT